MTFKDALNDFKTLFDQKLATSTSRIILQIQRDWVRINSNLHLYYVAYDVGDTDVANECIDDILAILLSYGFTADPPSSIGGGGGGVVPVDNFLDWDGSNLYYRPYTTQQAFLSLDTSTTTPTGTGRLNVNGRLHTTKEISGNISVLDGGVIKLREQTANADTDGDVRLRATSTGFFVERRDSGTWVSYYDITF
jgi:hypothetical protein